MPDPRTLTRDGTALAYHVSPGTAPDRGPGIVFLGGFRSDMEGTKALDLEAWARGQGRDYLRLDYSGHGASEGRFEGGCIGTWCGDALAVIEAATQGPQVLVGSSMGGWIALLIARDRPDLVAGLVTIAAAPDFTEDGYWAGFGAAERRLLETVGHVEVPSDYGAPYVITRHLIEDGRDRLILRSALPLPVPVRFLQGTEDDAVPTATALRLLDHAEGADMRLTLVAGADHRFSGPDELALIRRSVADVLERLGA